MLLLIPILLAPLFPLVSAVCNEYPPGQVDWGDGDNVKTALAAVDQACKTLANKKYEASEYARTCVDGPGKDGQFIFWVNSYSRQAANASHDNCVHGFQSQITGCKYGGRSGGFDGNPPIVYSCYPGLGRCPMGPTPQFSWTSQLAGTGKLTGVHARDAVETGMVVPDVIEPDTMGSEALEPDAAEEEAVEPDVAVVDPVETDAV